MPMINKIREDTEVWKCMQKKIDGTICTFANDPAKMLCEKCKVKRTEGAVANNDDGKRIGELKKVEDNGIEHWLFDDC
jgi:hypothetical protein